MTDADVAAAERALRSGRLVLGPENATFESGLAAACQRQFAVAVSSGTAALELALWACGVRPGDEVLIAGFGFPAAANASRRLGAHPIVVDCRASDWTLDTDDAARRVTPRSRVLVSVDQLGAVTDTEVVQAFADAHDLIYISDAACGLGGVSQDGAVGGMAGRVATLSFHARKVITTGEGGAIVTDDGELAQRVRELRNHGRTAARMRPQGTNARLSEAQAAMGGTQLARLAAMVEERRELAAQYCRQLAKLRERGRLSWQDVSLPGKHAYQSFAVLLADDLERAAVMAEMDVRGIETGPATYAFHVLAGGSDAEAPVSAALHHRSLSLPLYIGMTIEELTRVASALESIIG